MCLSIYKENHMSQQYAYDNTFEQFNDPQFAYN